MERKEKYKIHRFTGLGALVSELTGKSPNYCRDILKGKFSERDTESVHEILKAAEKISKPFFEKSL